MNEEEFQKWKEDRNNSFKFTEKIFIDVPLLISARKDAAAKQLAQLVSRFLPQAAGTWQGRHRLIGASR